MARKTEVATREQSNSVEWREGSPCQVAKNNFFLIQGKMPRQSSAENLAQIIKKGVAQTAAMKTGLALELSRSTVK